MNASLYTYLVMDQGDHQGRYTVLEAGDDIRLGRGLDCEIVLNDPLSSRVHAVIYCRDQQWQLRDADSRNGTFVDDVRIEDVNCSRPYLVR